MALLDEQKEKIVRAGELERFYDNLKPSLVPAATADEQGLYLRGDGTWAAPSAIDEDGDEVTLLSLRDNFEYTTQQLWEGNILACLATADGRRLVSTDGKELCGTKKIVLWDDLIEEEDPGTEEEKEEEANE